jgi:tetratricopeptide (TPR) repeat protein/tRNA A-37 threonylcarbamoyl transferase component Bud32
MKPGQVVANRFEIEKRTSAGSMAAVYRAMDRVTKKWVALKVLYGHAADEHTERFLREGRVLSELSHPGIVKYVAHGTTEEDEPFLAMEWLEGEDLSRRLNRTGLTMDESVRLVAKVADILSFSHARGIVHRDIKPANIFLCDKDLEQVKVLDFGIARIGMHSTAITGTGVMLGTLGYMSPEQARGAKEIDARADVFALGAVLFKCLTGQPAFSGEDAINVLAKVLFEDAPRVSAIRKDVPAALDDLVARLLAKEPDARPADAGVVAAELQALGPIEGTDVRRDPQPPMEVLTRSEQRLVSVVVAAAYTASADEEPTINDGTWTGLSALAEKIRSAVAPFGARFDALANGTLIATLAGRHNASEQAVRAARCALTIRSVAANLPMVVATGRGIVDERVPAGDAVERAIKMLNAHAFEDAELTTQGRAQPIRIDEVTAGLLDSRFFVRTDVGGLELLGERSFVDTRRTLLGKPTPCVGRDRELATLEGIFAECVGDDVARIVLITGAAGAGKSRVRYEFLRMLRGRDAPHEALLARGDPMRAGSPFGMVAQLVRRAAGVLDGEPPRVQQEKVRARCAKHLAGEDLARVSQFLGELIGVSFPDEDNVQLRAARNDAILMGDQMRRAFEDFLAVECKMQPLILVLEDLHWGDLPSVGFLDSALRTLADKPILVLALARPDVHDVFPNLWAGRGLHEMRLPDLTRKASEKLVRQVLGDAADDALVARIVTTAAGNAFYLEELIRAVAEGRDELPETVLTMVAARVESLEPEARRVLRAASVFGQMFWKSGALALLAPDQHAAAAAWLEELVLREVLAKREDSKFRGEEELTFRHALVREAAYGMLTAQDRALGHRLAAQWLESVGERDAVVLAEHFERGGEPVRAVAWYKRAATQALEGNDFAAALAHANRGLQCGAMGEARGALRRLEAEAHRWRGEHADAALCAREALDLLPQGGRAWCGAAGEAIEALGRLGDETAVLEIIDRLRSFRYEDATPPAAFVIALSRAAVQLMLSGRRGPVEEIVAVVEGHADAVARKDPRAAGHIYRARGILALVKGEPAAAIAHFRAAVANLEAGGDLRAACRHMVSMGSVFLELGAYDQAEQTLREALQTSERLGLAGVTAGAWHNLGMALARKGKLSEAQSLENAAIEAFAAQGDKRMEAASRLYLASIFWRQGELDEAEREAKAAMLVGSGTASVCAAAHAMIAHLLLARGHPAEALGPARDAMKILRESGGIEEGESFIRLVHAEALEGTRDRAGARMAIAEARQRLRARADKIAEPVWRRAFLDRVPENARTLQLAQEWGVD